jgi:hypothetical protein
MVRRWELVMNRKLTRLALEVGGSHYPMVSRAYLPMTVRLVIENAIQELELNGYDDAADCLKQHVKEYIKE